MHTDKWEKWWPNERHNNLNTLNAHRACKLVQSRAKREPADTRRVKYIKSLNTSFQRVQSWSKGTPHGVRDIGAFLKYCANYSLRLSAAAYSIASFRIFFFGLSVVSSARLPYLISFECCIRFAHRAPRRMANNEIENNRKVAAAAAATATAKWNRITRNCRRCVLLCPRNNMDTGKSTEIIDSMRRCVVRPYNE